ncbi:MAG: transporter substrate-binding domain-containing protein, partial [Campylobacteraceae bacterium]|nr:transporter substrate-binding domain-containing protein [Campylobacteraceae bacterium]
MKNVIYKCFIGVAFVFALSGCTNQNTQETVSKITTTQTIKDRGIIRIGVKGDTYKFGYKDPNTGIIDGFDVDVAKALAKKILGNEKKLQTVAVTTASREPMLNNDELDYVIATFTITEERKKILNFSNPYFIDSGIGMMVKKDSNIFSIKDLDNKKVGVAANTT